MKYIPKAAPPILLAIHRIRTCRPPPDQPQRTGTHPICQDDDFWQRERETCDEGRGIGTSDGGRTDEATTQE
ncbi:hypothetical protein QJS10_CPA08g00098 [Acorus calamus]|uniref:Uncharacterized protein n=1 Tax=Acorus calamus TaxID=4465 RepID=A0AAV9EC76_ACOCL|nr:hypothetical protein QJS10_CPA08g00098 [Acorus calamus]